jgi:ribosomal-protein-alanine N-acetyltransferase
MLALIEGGDTARLARLLDVELPPGWTDTIPARMRLAQLAADPSEQPWLDRAAVLRAQRRVIGGAGFHAPSDVGGRAEIG